MSVYNRLSRPIAVMGYRSAFMHLCEFTGLDPHNNDLLFHVHDAETACSREFCRVLEIDGAKETREYNQVKSLALARVRNEARATQLDPRQTGEYE